MSLPEAATLKLFEHSYYIGVVVSAIVYGINLTVYCLIVTTLFSSRKIDKTPINRFLAAFSTLLILLVTVCVATGSIWGEEMWISARDKPGGVILFVVTKTSIWYAVLGQACTFIMIFLADLFLIYRLYIIYAKSYIVVALPLLANLSAFVLAILQLVMLGQHLNFYHDGKIINLGTPYYSLTLSVNLSVTLLIVYRLRQLRKEVALAIGSDNARVYSNIAAIIAESAAPYTITAIAWIVAYARGNSTSVCFGVLSDELACLSPLVITLRILHRKGWSTELVSQTQNRTRGIQFRAGTDSVRHSHHESIPLPVSVAEKGTSRSLEPMAFKNWNSSSQSSV